MAHSNSGGAGDVAASILAALCCLWVCREATRPDDRVVIVEERTVVRPGYPPGRYRRKRRRYRNRRGFYDSDEPNVIIVNEKAGEKQRQDALPLVACNHMVMER